MIDINRRNAFAWAFKQYPGILEIFAENHCVLVDPTNGDRHPPSQNQRKFIMQIMMAQFFVRLLKTRARGGNPPMDAFAVKAVHAYLALKRKLIPVLEIEADIKYQTAVNALEQHMAATIFEALHTEAVMVDNDFDEADFWLDVFMAFVQNQKKHHPLWNLPVQAIITDRLPEFKQALAA